MYPAFPTVFHRMVVILIVFALGFSTLISQRAIPNANASSVPSVTIYYKKGFTTPYIHYQQANGVWTSLPGIRMNDAEIAGYAKITISLGTSGTLTACFNNGSGKWDSRNGLNYLFKSGVSTVDNGRITSGAPAGVPTITPTITPGVTATAKPTASPTVFPSTTPVSTIRPTVSPFPSALPTSTPPVSGVQVSFIIGQCLIKSGESCWIVGNFSNWSLNGGMKLSTGTPAVVYPKWTASKTFSANQTITFKAVTVSDATGKIISWENGTDRKLVANRAKTYIGSWGSAESMEIIHLQTPVPTVIPSPTATPLVTSTPTPLVTPLVTSTPTPPVTPTVSPTATPLVTSSPTPLVTPIVTSSPTPLVTPIVTSTPTPPVTPTVSPTATPLVTSSPTPPVTPTATPVTYEIKVYYKSSKSAFIHYKVDNGKWTNAPGVQLSASGYVGYQEFSYTNGQAFQLTAAFNDGQLQWDHNGGKNYTLQPGIFTIENGIVRKGVPYTGGNVITIFYPHELYDYGARYLFEYAHFRPEGTPSWTVAPGVPFVRKSGDPSSHVRVDLNIGSAKEIAELAFHLRSYAGNTWVNNGGSNYRNITPGTYTYYYGKLLRTAPDQLPGAPMAFQEAYRGVGHGCYEFCSYVSGTVRTVPLGNTQRVIVNYQIPSGEWKQIDALKAGPANGNRQLWHFTTPAVYMETPQRLYFQYVVDGTMIYVDNRYTANYNAVSPVIIGETKIVPEIGTGFGSKNGYFTVNGFETGAVALKEFNNQSAPALEVIAYVEGQPQQTIPAVKNGASSINGTLDGTLYEGYKFTLPIKSGKKTFYKLRATMSGISVTNDNNGAWFYVTAP